MIAYAHAHSNHAYASRVLETMKGNIFAHKFMWNTPHPYFTTIKSHKRNFFKEKEKHRRFTRK